MTVYNLDILKELLHDFYYLTNMKICIYDNIGNELCYYPEKFTDFCRLLRENPQMNEKCVECDKNAFLKCKLTKKQYFYTCHAGLLECISPILFNEKIIGYIVIGQIKDPEHSDFSDICGFLPENNFEELEKKFNKLPNANIQKIKSAIHILDACAGYEYLKYLVNFEEKRIDSKIDDYISGHLKDDLSVRLICTEFHLTHSEIYLIFKEYFNSTPAEYIKSCRIEKAKEMLRKSSAPINQIAIECGIPDYNYFTKVFKAHVGIAPRNFRRKNVL